MKNVKQTTVRSAGDSFCPNFYGAREGCRAAMCLLCLLGLKSSGINVLEKQYPASLPPREMTFYLPNIHKLIQVGSAFRSCRAAAKRRASCFSCFFAEKKKRGKKERTAALLCQAERAMAPQRLLLQKRRN